MVGRYGSDDNAAAPNVGLNPKTLTVQSLMTELKKYREIAESLLEGSGATQTEWLEGFGHESWSDVWTGAELTRELDALDVALPWQMPADLHHPNGLYPRVPGVGVSGLDVIRRTREAATCVVSGSAGSSACSGTNLTSRYAM